MLRKLASALLCAWLLWYYNADTQTWRIARADSETWLECFGVLMTTRRANSQPNLTRWKCLPPGVDPRDVD